MSDIILSQIMSKYFAVYYVLLTINSLVTLYYKCVLITHLTFTYYYNNNKLYMQVTLNQTLTLNIRACS